MFRGCAVPTVEIVRGSIVGATGILGCDIPCGCGCLLRAAEVPVLQHRLRAQHQAAPEHGLRERADVRARAGRVERAGRRDQSDLLLVPGKHHDLAGFAQGLQPPERSSRSLTGDNTDRRHAEAPRTSRIGSARCSASAPAACRTPPNSFQGNFVVAVQTIGGGKVAAGDSDSESSIERDSTPTEPGAPRTTMPVRCRRRPGRRRPPSPANPTAEIPNGIGNDCECGDVNRTSGSTSRTATRSPDS